MPPRQPAQFLGGICAAHDSIAQPKGVIRTSLVSVKREKERNQNINASPPSLESRLQILISKSNQHPATPDSCSSASLAGMAAFRYR